MFGPSNFLIVLPHSIRFIEELPRTQIGKVLRRSVREQLLKEEALQAPPRAMGVRSPKAA